VTEKLLLVGDGLLEEPRQEDQKQRSVKEVVRLV